jgi:hypothetical protein
MIWNNTIELQDNLSDGIDAYNTKDTVILNDTVTGTGKDAVGLLGSTLSSVIGNNLSGFIPDPAVGLAQIYIDQSTIRDLVVCAERSDTVLNQGTDNVVSGCQQPEATPEAAPIRVSPAVATPRPNLPKGKPWLHLP